MTATTAPLCVWCAPPEEDRADVWDAPPAEGRAENGATTAPLCAWCAPPEEDRAGEWGDWDTPAVSPNR